MTAQDAIPILVHRGFYDKAFSLAIAHNQDLTFIFESLVKHCLQQNEVAGENLESELSRTIAEDFETVSWKMLENYLEKYDNRETNYAYSECVLDHILSTQNTLKFRWLEDFLKWEKFADGNRKTRIPELLIRCYTKHGLELEVNALKEQESLWDDHHPQFVDDHNYQFVDHHNYQFVDHVE